MLNHVALQGRLVRDPELRQTGNGVSITSFTLAVNDRDDTYYIDCTAWRGTAETICKYLGKGRQIVVEGALKTRAWEDKDGNKRKAVEVNVSQFHFCDRKETPPDAPPAVPLPAVPTSGFAEIDDTDGDLPF